METKKLKSLEDKDDVNSSDSSGIHLEITTAGRLVPVPLLEFYSNWYGRKSISKYWT